MSVYVSLYVVSLHVRTNYVLEGRWSAPEIFWIFCSTEAEEETGWFLVHREIIWDQFRFKRMIITVFGEHVASSTLTLRNFLLISRKGIVHKFQELVHKNKQLIHNFSV